VLSHVSQLFPTTFPGLAWCCLLSNDDVRLDFSCQAAESGVGETETFACENLVSDSNRFGGQGTVSLDTEASCNIR